MKRTKKNLLRLSEYLSAAMTLSTLIWWILAEDPTQPRWLFFLSLAAGIFVAILDIPNVLTRRKLRSQGARVYEDLGRTPATYEQEARDREQKRFRLGAYRTTIRISLLEEQFIRHLWHRAGWLGYQLPEILTGEDGRRVLLKPYGIFESRVNRSGPNIEFDFSRLDATGEVDICAWEPPFTWILTGVAVAWGVALDVVCLVHGEYLFQFFMLFFIAVVIANTLHETRRQTRHVLKDLHLERETPFDAESEDEP